MVKLIKGLLQGKTLALVHLQHSQHEVRFLLGTVPRGGRTHGRQAISQHGLHKGPDDLEMHPSAKRLAEVGFAPSLEPRLLLSLLKLQRHEFTLRVNTNRLGSAVIADNEALLPRGRLERIEEIRKLALLELFVVIEISRLMPNRTYPS